MSIVFVVCYNIFTKGRAQLFDFTKGIKNMYNLDVRMSIKKNRLCHYEVAKEIGISEFTFCKWLREELPEDKKNLVLSAIERIVRGEANDK